MLSHGQEFKSPLGHHTASAILQPTVEAPIPELNGLGDGDDLRTDHPSRRLGRMPSAWARHGGLWRRGESRPRRSRRWSVVSTPDGHPTLVLTGNHFFAFANQAGRNQRTSIAAALPFANEK